MATKVKPALGHKVVFEHKPRVVSSDETWKGGGVVVAHKSTDYHWVLVAFNDSDEVVVTQAPYLSVVGLITIEEALTHHNEKVRAIADQIGVYTTGKILNEML